MWRRNNRYARAECGSPDPVKLQAAVHPHGAVCIAVDSAAHDHVPLDVTPFPDTNPTVGRKLPAGALLKLVTVVAMLLPDCVSSDPKSRSKLLFTPLMVELIEPASCVNALLKTCAPIVPIELAAGVVLVEPVAVEEDVELPPDVLGEPMTFVAPLLEAIARGPALDNPELPPPVTPARAVRRLFSMAFAGSADLDVDVVDEGELKEATNWSRRLFDERACIPFSARGTCVPRRRALTCWT